MKDDLNIEQFIQDMPDGVLQRLQFSVPWQYDETDRGYKDSDGFPLSTLGDKDDPNITREILQEQCWLKYQRNPYVNTAIRGTMGRLTGWGYETTSENEQIQEIIEDTELDHRNRLYDLMPKYVGRSHVEGELHVSLTVHAPPEVFVEVDFVDPSTIVDSGGDGSGIIFHPRKTIMPLFYNIKPQTVWPGDQFQEQVPSIYIARYPELIAVAKQHISKGYNRSLQQNSRSRKKAFRPFKGYNRFIVSWNRGLVTKRAISYLRTTLEWLNHYENLKKYEIDHKKSSGAYLWVFKIEDARSYKIWLSLSDEEKRKTGIMQKKTPGGSLVLPPGMSVTCENPQLASITDQDSDIKEMVTSGLNEPADVTTGSAKGTHASIKASRGPMSDRTSDEIAWFDRWAKYDFWSAILFFHTVLGNLPKRIPVQEAVSFTVTEKRIKNEVSGLMETKYEHVPVFKDKLKRPEQLIDISYPASEITDYAARSKGLLGVKHGSVSETLGISKKTIAGRIGVESYGRERLRKATEDKKYPATLATVDAESVQEKAEGEPSKTKSKAQEDK